MVKYLSMGGEKSVFKARPISLVLLLVAGFVAWRVLFADGGRSFSQRYFAGRPPNVILITVDTLRADRLSCYGFKAIATPTMDLFSSQGVRFENCQAQAPLTLPSHTTILTGTLPFYHGVRDNGGFLVPQELVSMAEVFQETGYATGAFVGAYVLDSRWGLDQGFDHYFDQFELSAGEVISLEMVQRRANEVMDQAIGWLEMNRDRPFFAWIHLYDPHSPYEPPEPYARNYADNPYLGEIAFVDAELGRLRDFLAAGGLLPSTILVVTADHGESLGEHQEDTHGFFLYEEALHVPLIFVTPIRKYQGLSVPETVALLDIMPTLLEMTGLAAPPGLQGRSLVPFFAKPQRKSPRLVYAETYYPRFHFGWSELRSVRDGSLKLILSSAPELYDLRLDPEERLDLAGPKKPILDSLKKDAERFIADHSRGAFVFNPKTMDGETREKLAALGYVGSFVDLAMTTGLALANPRDKIGVYNELSRARERGMTGCADEAIAVIQKIIAREPNLSEAHYALGDVCFRSGRFEEAIVHFRRSLDLKPDDTIAVLNIAQCHLRLGRADDAEEFLNDSLRKGFQDSQVYSLLGYIKFSQHRYEDAVSAYQQSLSMNPDSASVHNALGAAFFRRQDLARAEQHFRLAMSFNPELANVNYNLARVFEEKGMNEAAMDAYRQEIRLSPRHFQACFNLANLYRVAGNDQEEGRLLELCLENNPDFPLTYFYLARILLNRGENLERAMTLVQKGISLEPERGDLAYAYSLLAGITARMGKARQSQEAARKSRELSKAPPSKR